jgi:O-antigen ligase
VGIALAFAIAAALFGRRISALVKPMLWATVQAIAGYLVLFVIAPDLNGNALDDNEYLGSRMSSVQARFYLWRLALQYIRAHPLLGVGPMHYAHFPNGEAAHPHNIYLQLAAEWGVPFAIVVSLAALWALWSLARAIKSAPVERSMDGVLPFIAVIAAAVDGFFSGNFVMPTSQVWIALAAGSALGWYWQQSAAISGLNQSVGRSTAGAIRCLLVAVLVSQVWLLHVTLSDLPGLHERLKQIEQRTGGTQSARFWSEGWF